LASFDGTNGSQPEYVSLVQGLSGSLFGPTSGGGAYSNGTIFKITKEGSLTTVYSFPEVAGIEGVLMPTVKGTFYGTTQGGGTYGYGTVFINPPDHLAVGILGNNLPGTSYICNNQTYYYCETTGPGFTIGQLPQQFTGQKVYVYPIDESEQYVPNLQSTSSNIPNPTIQPVLPISVNLISDEPILFILIILAIVISITVTVKTAGKSKQITPFNQTVSPKPSSPKMAEANLETNKFCVYCGSSNKSFAVYCEKCGKKIA